MSNVAARPANIKQIVNDICVFVHLAPTHEKKQPGSNLAIPAPADLSPPYHHLQVTRYRQ
jgi:hypothetical protein